MKVFTPISIKNLTIKNRIARSATHEYLENPDGTYSERQLDILEELAKNGVGMIITGHMYVAKQGQASALQNAAYDDKFIPGMKQVVHRVHKHGGIIIAQINHAGVKADTEDPVGPSALELIPGRKGRKMTSDEMMQVKSDFVSAAKRVKSAGFDGVQIHMAHNYLLSEFVTPEQNMRTDWYSGSAENRFRFPKEILTEVIEAVGKDFPVLVKINSNVPSDDENYESEMLYMIKEMAHLGVAAVELSGCDFVSKKGEIYYLERAARLRQAVDIPIILVGGIRSLNNMETVLDAGIDMVALSRPFICEPDLIQRLENGQERSSCIACNRCFSLPKKEGIRCSLHKKVKG